MTMDIHTFLRLAREWDQLADTVKDQLSNVVINSEELEDQNPKALHATLRFLRKAITAKVEDTDEIFNRIDDHLTELRTKQASQP